MLQVEVDDWSVWLRVIAYGDYNGDGFEDMLVYIGHEATPGTLGYSFYAILTRQSVSQALHRIAISKDQAH